jgi:hypothetical protein
MGVPSEGSVFESFQASGNPCFDPVSMNRCRNLCHDFVGTLSEEHEDARGTLTLSDPRTHDSRQGKQAISQLLLSRFD